MVDRPPPIVPKARFFDSADAVMRTGSGGHDFRLSRLPRPATWVVLLCLLIGLSGVGALLRTGGAAGSVDPVRLRPFYKQTITWTPCRDTFECGWLTVPLDYSRPAGKTIKLALIRKPATDPARRIGSLLFNPGGPGASGLEYAKYTDLAFSAALRERFDVVGFDPRGVGESAPIHCLDDKQRDDYMRVDGTPDDGAEEKALVDAIAMFAAACRQHSGDLLAHISTLESARDMDVLRAALGDAKLTYLGWSYGTALGTVYAERFPRQVGRLVFDGAIDPRMNSLAATQIQATGFEVALDAFLHDCAARPDCPLGTDRRGARQRLADLLQRTDRTPLTGDGARTVNEPLASMGIITAMYSKSSWSELRTALQEAIQENNGGALLSLADSLFSREPDGHYTTNFFDAFNAIGCLDSPPAARSIQEVKQQLPSFRALSPIFGTGFAWGGLSCASWPVPPVGMAHEIRAPGAAPILVVGTTRDPATPYEEARALAEQLTSGVLLTYDGDGHTAYRGGANPCIDDAVDAYLLEGRLPAKGTWCS
jgi:pimeloyl-ACP methyl ester carboxylesterase